MRISRAGPRVGNDQKNRPVIRGALLVLLIAVAGAAAPRDVAAAEEGKVKFLRNATSAFDRYTSGATSSERAWIRAHYWRIRGYPPFFDQALGWAPPAHFAQNLYALYRGDRSDEELMDQHPEWVLRDSSGRRLYIPSGCNGTSCPLYAADPGNPEWRAHWISLALDKLGRGYVGMHIDDVNMTLWVSDGSGKLVRPIDPRTGQPMTDTNWRRYTAEFTEAIRAAFPLAEISHNAGQWWTPHSDPYFQREIDSADIIELERGFNDPGLVGGTGTFGFQTYLAHTDWLHSRGKSYVVEPYNLNSRSRKFELAGYFLTSAGGDSIAADYLADPDKWWRGWEADLGNPVNAVRTWTQGVMKRAFARGTAFLNPPGSATRTIRLNTTDWRWTNFAGSSVSSFTLDAREGQVLYKAPR